MNKGEWVKREKNKNEWKKYQTEENYIWEMWKMEEKDEGKEDMMKRTACNGGGGRGGGGGEGDGEGEGGGGGGGGGGRRDQKI